MLDFRRNSNVPNYLGAKHQRRLLVALAVAGVAAIVVFQARHLGRGNWFAARQPAAGVAASPSAQGAPLADSQPRGVADQQGSAAPIDRLALFAGVRGDYLGTVQDDTVFRAAEADAWFHLWALLEKTDQRDLERASLGRVGYLQLDQQSDGYRGRLVTIEGTVRGAKLVTAPPNDYSIEQYYQLWLQPQRGSPALVAVYALELPEGFPLGTDLEASCTATGFFFKRWAYRSQEGIATAPLVLARTVDWAPSPPAVADAPPAVGFVWMLLIALVLAVAVMGFFIVRQRAVSRLRRSPADSRQLQAVLLSEQAEHQIDRGDVADGETDRP